MSSILGDESFYKKNITYKLKDVLETYSKIIKDFCILFYEKNKIKNIKYFEFILERGIKTLNHVFIFLLMYVKNLPIVLNECKKSYFYYIEFIEQIMDEEYNFLHLSSEEATLFVYKKSIYEISNNYRKKNSKIGIEEEDFLKNLSIEINIINNKILKLVIKSMEEKVPVSEFKENFIN